MTTNLHYPGWTSLHPPKTVKFHEIQYFPTKMSDHFGGPVRFSPGCIILVGDHFSGHTFSLVRAYIILVVQNFLGFYSKNLDRIRDYQIS